VKCNTPHPSSKPPDHDLPSHTKGQGGPRAGTHPARTSENKTGQTSKTTALQKPEPPTSTQKPREPYTGWGPGTRPYRRVGQGEDAAKVAPTPRARLLRATKTPPRRPLPNSEGEPGIGTTPNTTWRLVRFCLVWFLWLVGWQKHHRGPPRPGVAQRG